MFTGLIQAVGSVHSRGQGLIVKSTATLSPLNIGDSVAVDGVCLTISDLIPNGFLADVSEETLSRTTLGAKAQKGCLVNLEPALRFSDRLGGHIVSGHVDGLGEVITIESLENSWHLELTWKDKKFGRFICEKASISVDGVSLTVAGCSDEGDRFSVAVIPHTWGMTSMKNLSPGNFVNLEADILAKYLERLMHTQNKPFERSSSLNTLDLSKDWLANHGWD